MASQGPLNPTAASGGTGWSGVTGIEANTSSALSPGITAGSAGTTNNIQGTTFGFSIPAGQIIKGISVTISAEYNNGAGDNANLANIQLLKAGSAAGSSKTGATVTTSLADYTSGSNSDLWGTTWSVSDINASGFGVQFGFFINNADGSGTAKAQTRNVRITVTYQSPVSRAVCSQTIGW